jgi:hypothetical protein
LRRRDAPSLNRQEGKLDAGNLSRSIGKWIEAGVVIRVGDEKLPLHVYPLTKATADGR